MPPSLTELKVTPSFCFAFKITDDVTASNTQNRIHRRNQGTEGADGQTDFIRFYNPIQTGGTLSPPHYYSPAFSDLPTALQCRNKTDNC